MRQWDSNGNLIDAFTLTGSNVADGWEDPFGSGRGHTVVSETETMKKRMARLGSIKSKYANKVTLTQSTDVSLVNMKPTDGYILMPLKIEIAMTGPGLVIIEWNQRLNQSSEVPGGTDDFITRYFGAAGNWGLDLSGEIMVGDGCTFRITCNADGTGSFAWASMIYAEELV